MHNKKIQILYIATNGYINYGDYFFGSIDNFFPNDELYVTVLTNMDVDFNHYINDHVKDIQVIKMFDLFYPCINLHKPYFIKQLKQFDKDYFFYFDADTIFKNVPDYDWDNFKVTLDNDNVAISKHPMYAANDSVVLYDCPKYNWISNFCTSNMTEKNTLFSSCIPDVVYDYVISSFFAANSKTMEKLCDKLIEMVRFDLKRDKHYHIPQFMDENYFNKLAYVYTHGISDEIKFSVNQYSEMNGVESDFYPTVFMIQKNINGNFKTNRQ